MEWYSECIFKPNSKVEEWIGEWKETKGSVEYVIFGTKGRTGRS